MSTLTKSQAKPAANGQQRGHAYQFCLPLGLVDLDSYRQWARSPSFPERGEFAFLDGYIWVDLSMEQLFTHCRIKTHVSMVLNSLVETARLGYFFSDGVLLSNPTANLSCKPDASYVSFATLQAGGVQFIEGKEHGFVELEGAPDMMLEIVSDSSVAKDTVTLRDLYWRAGVTEFWLVDVRGETVQFDILKRGKKGYTATRRESGGWLPSTVFKLSFLLTRQLDPLGNPQFTLSTRT